jgi:uncharacterized protein YdeI (YjbR/CyaY-like superfamily)
VNCVPASGAAEWRAWLARRGRSEKEAWLVIHHRDSDTPGVGYEEAVEHALCYGWIDSQARRHDAGSMLLRFTPRGPRSRWSRVNRERAARLIGLGLMTEDGRAAIERARATGTWEVVPDAAGSAMRDDLRAGAHPPAPPSALSGL